MNKSRILVLGKEPFRPGSILILIIFLVAALALFASWKKNSEIRHLPRVDSLVSTQLHQPINIGASLSRLCFMRGEWIYLLDLASGRETKLIEGAAPDLSPAGDEVVFISGKHPDPYLESNPGVAKNLSHFDNIRIKILDVHTNEVRDLNILGNLQASRPQWSTDGTRIAVQILNSDVTRLDIGVLVPSTGKFQIITKEIDLGNPAEPIYLDSWVEGDQSILFHSLKFLYETRVDGTLVQKIPLEDLDRGGISSATRFSLSSDRRYLLFDRVIDTTSEPEHGVISIFDLNSKQISNITPNTLEGRTPMWLPSTKEILFTCLKRFERPFRPNVCKTTITGTEVTTLASNADYASFSIR